MKKWGYAWGGLATFAMMFGIKLFVFGVTGSEMIRGIFLLLTSGYALARSVHFLHRKEDEK